MTEEILYKRRSSIACLIDALELMNNNIATILRKCWPYMLATALLTAVILTAMIDIYAEKPLMINAIVLTVASVAAIVASALFYGKIIAILSGNAFISTAKRIALFLLLLIVLIVIFVTIQYGTGYALAMVAVKHFSILKHINIIVLGVSLMLSVFFVVATVLLVYAGMKYFYGNTSLNRIHKEYKTGMHYFFFIFGTLLLLAFVVAIIATIVGLPITILIQAAINSTASIMIGDPNDLPGNFTILTFASTSVVAIVYSLLTIWELLVVRYIYGSIEKRIEMKKIHTADDN